MPKRDKSKTKEAVLAVWLKTAIYVLAVLAVLTPLIPRHSLSSSHILWKTMAFQITVEIMLVLWALLSVTEGRRRPRLGTVGTALAVFVAVTIASLFFSVDWRLSFWSTTSRMTGVVTLLHLFAWFAMLTSVIRGRDEWRRLFYVSVTTSTVVSVAAVVEWFGSPDRHLVTMMGNTSMMSSFVLPHVFLAAYLLIGEKSAVRKAFLIASMSAGAAAIFFAASRAAVLSLVFGSVLLAVGAAAHSAWRRGRKAAVCASVILTLVALVSSAVVLRFAPQGEDLATRVGLPYFARRLIFRGFGEDRLVLWDYALKGFAQRPVFGWGNDQFTQIAGAQYDPNGPEQDIFGEMWYDRAHNQYLDTLVSYGAVGLVAYLIVWAVVCAVLLSSYRMAVGAPQERKRIFFLATVIMTYLLYSTFMFDTPQALVALFLVLAAVSSLYGSEGAESAVSRPISSPVALRAVMAAVFPAAALLIIVANVMPALSAIHFRRAVETFRLDRAAAAREYTKAFRGPNPYLLEQRYRAVHAVRPFVDYGAVSDFDTVNLLRMLSTESNKSVATHPNSTRALYAAALANRMLAPFDGESAVSAAERYVNEMASAAPRRFDWMRERAEILVIRGDYAGAREWFDRTIAASFSSNVGYRGELIFRKAAVAALERDFVSMYSELEAASALGFETERDHRLVSALSRTAVSGDDLGRLRDYLDRVAQNFQNQPEVLRPLARVYGVMGEDARARWAQGRLAGLGSDTGDENDN